MKLVMIDIEGMNLVPHKTRIMQLSAAFFDEEGNILSTFNEFSGKEPHMFPDWTWDDPDTMKFWKAQPTWEKMVGAMAIHGRSYQSMIKLFREWFIAQSGEERTLVYACGPQYDIATLDEYFRQLSYEAPWRYSSVRDYRTIRAQYEKLVPGSFEYGDHMAHNDVVAQIHNLVQCIRAGYIPS